MNPKLAGLVLLSAIFAGLSSCSDRGPERSKVSAAETRQAALRCVAPRHSSISCTHFGRTVAR